jgi:hypothetical protein
MPPEVLGAPEAAPEPARPYRLMAAVVGLIAVAGSVGYARLHTVRSPVHEGAAVAPAAEATAGSLPATAPGAASAQDPAKPVTEVDFFALAPGTTATTAASVKAPPTGPAAAGAAAAAKPKTAVVAPATAPKAPATPAPAAKATSDCNPSYYYDADGNKHFKPECFGR